MILKQGRNDHTYKVCAINTEHSQERRLEALGLTEGAFVTILNNNKKGALTVKFRGTRFAVGRHIAEHIEVEEVGPSCPTLSA